MPGEKGLFVFLRAPCSLHPESANFLAKNLKQLTSKNLLKAPRDDICPIMKKSTSHGTLWRWQLRLV